ncbi:uncharacterized protein L969DRAFT_86140 [Mixia osmundae IAM 14324]|uniref:VWFA domain-containing protein n=1 Tax=Mixia osmundae (strain CBS 9802 / IAM 14324 / JCM 22182 / KY 12970) TaxID=764103 RepID=G7EAS0_MIXOS|nr:uncharacterized protein L969DRAFT_86140 [Mixia osmundae IAM 14324]KEI40899.1 hypothetical protein L969DRAFT_86140 [Mixia osmundae IAM 14324]GAA99930.1 hypothetical protein E5Q_06633 [Mixia osmundae IAM 14324]
MPLEACMIVLDNSSYAINGDYTPDRFGAQSDAATTIFNAKTNSNPESVCGLMTMAGKAPKVLVTPTEDIGKITVALHSAKESLDGEIDLATGINVASLALKHRQNKSQQQRIVAFVGSPLAHASCTSSALVRLGKKMRKNNIAVDIVSFGEGEENDEKLKAFIEAVHSGDNHPSHLLHAEPSGRLLSDVIISSPILERDSFGGGAGPSGTTGTGAGDDEFGIDPNLDPELALALRMSLEEARAREAPASSAAPALDSISESAPATAGPTETDAHAATPASAPAPANAQTGSTLANDDEDDELARAIALSRGDDVEMGNGDHDGTALADGMDEDDDSEEAQIARAIALSMAQDEEEQPKPSS